MIGTWKFPLISFVWQAACGRQRAYPPPPPCCLPPCCAEPVFVNLYGAQESIPPAYAARRAGMTNRAIVRPASLGIDSWAP
jgi:hypothetical protein